MHHDRASPRRCGGYRVSRLAVALSLLGATLAPAPVAAQTVEGVLLERGTDQPIDLGYLLLLTLDGDSVAATLSDREGRFSVTAAEPGDYLLHAAALGYESRTNGVFALTEGGGVSVEYRIPRRPIEIGGLTVDAVSSAARQPSLVRNGFVDRARMGRGRFLTPVDIARSAQLSTADLLATTGRVHIMEAGPTRQIRMLGTRGYCTPAVYVDNIRISGSDLYLLEARVPLSTLQAAEVYRSPNEAPIRYGGGMGGCGVIVLWTR